MEMYIEYILLRFRFTKMDKAYILTTGIQVATKKHQQTSLGMADTMELDLAQQPKALR